MIFCFFHLIFGNVSSFVVSSYIRIGIVEQQIFMNSNKIDNEIQML